MNYFGNPVLATTDNTADNYIQFIKNYLTGKKRGDTENGIV